MVTFVSNTTPATTAQSIGRGDNYSWELDDRQELVKTISGAVAVDPWNDVRRDTGDTVQFTATFDNTNADVVIGYWARRQRVTVTLDDGTQIANARIICRQIATVEGFYRTHKKLTIEVWRV